MRPHVTMRNTLVHPKDKHMLEPDKTVNCVYEIPCKICPQTNFFRPPLCIIIHRDMITSNYIVLK